MKGVQGMNAMTTTRDGEAPLRMHGNDFRARGHAAHLQQVVRRPEDRQSLLSSELRHNALDECHAARIEAGGWFVQEQ